MECYSASTRKEILPLAPTQVNLEDMMLSDISQAQEDTNCLILLMRSQELSNSETGGTMEITHPLIRGDAY